jgi:MATE family multidrug resistance protein
MLAWCPMVGASVATTTLVGQYIGRRDYATAAKSAYTAFIAVELYMLSFALLYITSAESLIRIFQNQAETPGILFADILPLGKQILLYVALYQIFDAMLLTFSGALRGAGDTAFAMWACVICAWCIFVPGTWLVVEVLQWGVMSAWIWIFIYCASLGIIYLLRFQSGRWKQFDVIANEPKIVF